MRLVGVPAGGGEPGPVELDCLSGAHRPGYCLEAQQPAERPRWQSQVPGYLPVHILAAVAEPLRQLGHPQPASVAVQQGGGAGHDGRHRVSAQRAGTQ
jgi:hypothetical protein